MNRFGAALDSPSSGFARSILIGKIARADNTYLPSGYVRRPQGKVLSLQNAQARRMKFFSGRPGATFEIAIKLC
ncbi:hypothetical protein FJ950_28120 [Mesorhizobium sp. B2-3-14]|uniref:hypothetical protein n=1 Tax=unclassified Mesorhizobium TaxID=325217 RepID=UPI00112D1AA7|nr:MULTISPECIES: hypothetical protein [unclassified Mesorhizobium]TPL79277.1 hypothetical protein FJ950_28120 [Mesorhizobium sp. B2-3-14]